MEPSFPIPPKTLALFCRGRIMPTLRPHYIPTLRTCIKEFNQNTAIPFYNCIEDLMLRMEDSLRNEASLALSECEAAFITRDICLELMRGLREQQVLTQEENR